MITKSPEKKRLHRLAPRALGGASCFVLLTGVPRVAIGFGTPREEAFHEIEAGALIRHLEAGEFPEGSMGPKVEAALQYIAAGGREAIITDYRSLRAALAGKGAADPRLRSAAPGVNRHRGRR